MRAGKAAAAGDTVVVAPGVYVEIIDFLGKAITVRSSGGPRVTIIDGGRAGPVVTFRNSEGASSVIEGFTITGGFSSLGGGVYCDGSSPTIRGNRITANHSSGYDGGGGITCYESSPEITGNTISFNTAVGAAGGIYCDERPPSSRTT